MQPAGAEMNILLLSDGSWDRTVRLAAASMSAAALRQVRSIPAALAQLSRVPAYSCVLMQATQCPDNLRQLTEIARSTGHGTAEIIVLGQGRPAPDGVTVLPTDISTETLSRVLASIEEGSARAPVLELRQEGMAETLAASRLHTRYQPIVSIRDGMPLALEVLARLDHPLLGSLKPAQFVPQIEYAGLGCAFTRSVIETTMSDYRRHLTKLGMALAVNFPLDVLLGGELAGWLAQHCERVGLPTRSVIIELTESQPVARLDADARRSLGAAMADLRRMGFRLALDDFGPAIPERQLLLDLEFDLLKLDKSIVNDETQARVVEQAVNASHGRFQIIAEGIEDEPAWRRMAAMGVDFVQGFLVSRPLPAANVVDWLEDWQGRLA